MAALLSLIALTTLARLASAGTTIWSGSFNAYPTVADFDQCESDFSHRFKGSESCFRVLEQ